MSAPELRYLLRHQTETPTKTIASGSTNWLNRRTMFICARGHRHAAVFRSLGRMEIRSSSEDSQFMAFSASRGCR